MKMQTKIIIIIIIVAFILFIFYIYEVPMMKNLFPFFMAAILITILFLLLEKRSSRSDKDVIKTSSEAFQYIAEEWQKLFNTKLLVRHVKGSIMDGYALSKSGKHRFFVAKLSYEGATPVVVAVRCSPKNITWDFDPSIEVLRNPFRLIPNQIFAVPDPILFDEETMDRDPHTVINMPLSMDRDDKYKVKKRDKQ